MFVPHHSPSTVNSHTKIPRWFPIRNKRISSVMVSCLAMEIAIDDLPTSIAAIAKDLMWIYRLMMMMMMMITNCQFTNH